MTSVPRSTKLDLGISNRVAIKWQVAILVRFSLLSLSVVVWFGDYITLQPDACCRLAFWFCTSHKMSC